MSGMLRNLLQKGYLPALMIAALAATPLPVRCQDLEPIFLAEAPTRERRGPPQFESEHRPVPVRRYRINAPGPYGSLQVFLRRPDGKVSAVQPEKQKGAMTVSFKTPFGDGPMHGIHTLYVVDRQVQDSRLTVRTAKWHTLHHSCGWGHGHKYQMERITVPPQTDAPMEISCNELWDGNYHSQVRSGDRLRFRVYSHGVPVSGAKVRLTSGRGWTRETITGKDGSASFQLVRDYYPERWLDFDSRHRERFTVVAEYEIQQQGRFSGSDYGNVRYITSIPWTYIPSRQDYTSGIFGLFIGFITMALAAAGVYIYRERRSRPYREMRFNEKF